MWAPWSTLSAVFLLDEKSQQQGNYCWKQASYFSISSLASVLSIHAWAYYVIVFITATPIYPTQYHSFSGQIQHET